VNKYDKRKKNETLCLHIFERYLEIRPVQSEVSK
jgi:hypothetical protein